jgi:hypothetical protein
MEISLSFLLPTLTNLFTLFPCFLWATHTRSLSMHFRCTLYTIYSGTRWYADPSGRSIQSVGLRPLACWDCGFESLRGHGCLSAVSIVYCQVEVSSSSLLFCPKESYRLWCVVVCDLETSWIRWDWPTGGFCAENKAWWYIEKGDVVMTAIIMTNVITISTDNSSKRRVKTVEHV